MRHPDQLRPEQVDAWDQARAYWWSLYHSFCHDMRVYNDYERRFPGLDHGQRAKVSAFYAMDARRHLLLIGAFIAPGYVLEERARRAKEWGDQ